MSEDVLVRIYLARIAVEAPHALRLAAQLFGVEPCEECGYIKSHCRCAVTTPKKEE